MTEARPLHQRLAAELREEIETGTYPRGSRLPSEHVLAEQHDVARGTVRQALATLRSEGAIAVHRGSRPVVLGPAKTQSFSELQSFTSWARARGEIPTGRVSELGLRASTPAEAGALGLEPGAAVLRLVRVRLLGGRPVMIERTAFPQRVATFIDRHELDEGSVYEQLARHGIVVAQARHLIDAVAANTTDARLLDVPRRSPLLRNRRLGMTGDGTAIEWSDDRYRPDAVAFGVDNSATVSPLTRVSGIVDVDRRAS